MPLKSYSKKLTGTGGRGELLQPTPSRKRIKI